MGRRHTNLFHASSRVRILKTRDLRDLTLVNTSSNNDVVVVSVHVRRGLDVVCSRRVLETFSRLNVRARRDGSSDEIVACITTPMVNYVLNYPS